MMASSHTSPCLYLMLSFFPHCGRLNHICRLVPSFQCSQSISDNVSIAWAASQAFGAPKLGSRVAVKQGVCYMCSLDVPLQGDDAGVSCRWNPSLGNGAANVLPLRTPGSSRHWSRPKWILRYVAAEWIECPFPLWPYPHVFLKLLPTIWQSPGTPSILTLPTSMPATWPIYYGQPLWLKHGFQPGWVARRVW